MGNDEHGPAYPEPEPHSYRCPICRGDENRYMTCEYPGCPDARDPLHPVAQARFVREKTDRAQRARLAQEKRAILVMDSEEARLRRALAHPPARMPMIGAAIQLAIVVAFLCYLFVGPAWPMDHGFNPNDRTVKWMESLQRPDMPPGPCCGKGDGYPVSDYWDNHDGTWTAVIGDGSAIKYPDGTTREYIATGTEVIVPNGKVNKWEDDLHNPTDVSWIFMTVHAAEVGSLYCLIRHPSGN